MNRKTMARLEARAELVRALAHPTRLGIVEELARGERSVGQLQAAVDCGATTLSRHLALLRALRIVETRRRGTTVLCTLAMPCLGDFLACVDAMLHHDSKRRRKIAEHLPTPEP